MTMTERDAAELRKRRTSYEAAAEKERTEALAARERERLAAAEAEARQAIEHRLRQGGATGYDLDRLSREALDRWRVEQALDAAARPERQRAELRAFFAAQPATPFPDR